MTTPTQLIGAITGWSCRLFALSLMIVAVGETVQFGLCWLEERRHAR